MAHLPVSVKVKFVFAVSVKTIKLGGVFVSMKTLMVKYKQNVKSIKNSKVHD